MRKGDPSKEEETSTITESRKKTETQSLNSTELNTEIQNSTNTETQNLKNPDPGVGISWPEFHNFDKTYPTRFESGSWICPLCNQKTPRIRQHLATHKGLIQDWGLAEEYCNEVAILKRKELERKRAQDSKRRESKRKADKKRDPKRAEDPQRKEALKMASKKPLFRADFQVLL